jgi:hypothetical protein
MNKLEQASNPNTPIKTLEQLATDKNSVVRWMVAENPNTPTKSLEQLATDKNSSVRCRVAKNLNTPHYIKKYLKFQYHMTLLNLYIKST